MWHTRATGSRRFQPDRSRVWTAPGVSGASLGCGGYVRAASRTRRSLFSNSAAKRCVMKRQQCEGRGVLGVSRIPFFRKNPTPRPGQAARVGVALVENSYFSGTHAFVRWPRAYSAGDHAWRRVQDKATGNSRFGTPGVVVPNAVRSLKYSLLPLGSNELVEMFCATAASPTAASSYVQRISLAHIPTVHLH